MVAAAAGATQLLLLLLLLLLLQGPAHRPMLLPSLVTSWLLLLLLLLLLQVCPVYQGPVQLSAAQLLQLLHYQQVLHSLLNWSSKVGGTLKAPAVSSIACTFLCTLQFLHQVRQGAGGPLQSASNDSTCTAQTLQCAAVFDSCWTDNACLIHLQCVFTTKAFKPPTAAPAGHYWQASWLINRRCPDLN
jgi:hypothetical protein